MAVQSALRSISELDDAPLRGFRFSGRCDLRLTTDDMVRRERNTTRGS
jgi:hypothetical protein